ncbi:MAG: IPT/TIG domain-containing protein [Myxococcales bacterium]|nr:IPT/TIG domain-containing protein [Myxococcales bacterium]
MKLIKVSLLALLFAAASACSDSGGNGTPDKGPTPDAATEGGNKADLTPDSPTQPDAPVADLPVIERIIPASGPSDGGKSGEIPVTLVGQNFKPGMTVYIDGGQAIITAIQYTSGVSISFKMPKNPYGPPYDQASLVSVSVNNGAGTSKSVNFQYWVEKAADTDNNGVIPTAQHEAFRDYASPPVEVRVYAKGVTDTTTGDPGAAKLRVQIGIGKQGDDATKDYSFIWTEATFKSDDSNHDVFEAGLTPPLEQDYAVVARFSTNGGRNWTFVDSTDDMKYTPADAAVLKVSPAPQNYCVTKQDCATNAYAQVCKLDPTDWKAHRCIECKATADCTANKNALGPTCDTQSETCGCPGGDGDCAGRPTGKKCLNRNGGGTACGCGSDDDCDWPNGQMCQMNGLCA